MESHADARGFIEAELIRRCQRNPRYSLRAFARSLEVSPSFLSRVLSGKRALTVPVARSFSQALDLTPEQQRSFLDLVVRAQPACGGRRRKAAAEAAAPASYAQLSADAFAVIAEWHHYALTELVYLRRARTQDLRWIARMLGIPLIEARASVERLKRLGILRQEKGGRLAKTERWLTTTHDVASVALRRFHAQVLERARRSLEETPVGERDVTSITMAIDPARLPEAKARIKRFRRSLSAYLEAGDRTRVYSLAIQLFPLTPSSLEEA